MRGDATRVGASARRCNGSVGVDAAWATAVLKKAGDSSENPTSHWIFCLTRRAIKSESCGLVLFGTEAAAAKDADEKKSVKDKIKRRRVRAAFAPPAAKAAAKKKVASAVAKAKTLRGTGLSVESFARTVAKFC